MMITAQFTGIPRWISFGRKTNSGMNTIIAMMNASAIPVLPAR